MSKSDEQDGRREELLKVMGDSSLRAIERVYAGIQLDALGDPRFDAEHWFLPKDKTLGFVRIPAGTFLMGSDYHEDNEKPQHKVNLPEFWLAKYPVTVAQFRAFTDDQQRHFPYWYYENNLYSNHPVVYVEWYDALAYCDWLGAHLQAWARHITDPEMANDVRMKPFIDGLADGSLRLTLPSEAEWEKAARGKDGRNYPWGDVFDTNFANTRELDTRTEPTGKKTNSTAVGCFPGGESPFGLFDMSGNVREWTRSLGKGVIILEYPYKPGNEREDLTASSDICRVIRGGSFWVNNDEARCSYRDTYIPKGGYFNIGFRVAISPTPSSE